MKMLMFSDLHFRNTGAGEKVEGALKVCVDACKWFADLVLAEEPDIVVFLGDAHDNPIMTDIPTVVKMVQSFRDIAAATSAVGAKFVAIDGNHDKFDYTGDNSITSVLLDIPNLQVVQQFATIGNCSFIAFQRDIKVFRSYLKAAQSSDYLFIHQDVMGALQYPWAPVSSTGVSAEELERFRFVFAGHYHMPQQFENMIVVGAPVYSSFRDQEVENPRGAVLYDMTKNSIVRIENPTTPKYISFRFSDETEKQMRKQLKPYLNSNYHVRVIAPRSAVEFLQQFKDKAAELRIKPFDETEERDIESVDLSTSPDSLFKRWLDNQPEDIKDRLADVGGRIMDEVRTSHLE